MKYLFICTGNTDRSPTAAKICNQIAKEKGLEIEVESAGLLTEGGRQLSKEIANSADRIFVMEERMIKWVVEEYFQPREKIVCLNVRDDYDTAHPKEKEKLERIFREKLPNYVK